MDRQLIESMAASLRALARRGGEEALDDVRRVRGKLADDHPAETAARTSVAAALDIGVPARLKDADPQLVGVAIQRETALLQSKFGTERAFARGAVEVWAQTLRIAYALEAKDEAPIVLTGPERFLRQLGYIRTDFRQAWREQPLGMAVIVGAPIAALAASLFWPGPAFDASDPVTWPIDQRTAVILHRSLLQDCPSSGWRLTRRWRLISSGPSGIACLHSFWDLGTVHLVGDGVDGTLNRALMLSLTPKDGPCPAGTAYETVIFCLRRLPPPVSGDGR